MKYLLSLAVCMFMGICAAQTVLLSENFASGLPVEWEVQTDGKRAWEFKTFRDASYMQMSAYAGKGKKGLKVKSTLFSPLLDLPGKQCSLRFSMANAFANGKPLRILLYTPKKTPSLEFANEHFETLIDNPDFYNNIYKESDWIPMPIVSEPRYLAFVYDTHKVSATTTLQIGEVDVWCVEVAQPESDALSADEDDLVENG
ncbi:MAG: choice-of-anchor J domain-containing protein [Weeksellaceae bacterium]|nr:choice-of-anchor J domain-containing protein [Weeksellaceae bacterium]